MRLRFKEIRNPYIKSSPDSMIKNKVFEEK